MWFDFAECPAENRLPNVDIRTAFHVKGDETYSVPNGRKQGLVAVMTRAGEGIVTVTAREYRLQAGTVILLDGSDIISYGTADKKWHFWWFEFFSDLPLRAGLGIPFRTGTVPGEEENFRMILDDLKQNNSETKSRACYRFGAVLLSWFLAVTGTEQQKGATPYSQTIHTMAEEMSRLPLETLDTAALAKRAGLGACRFVQVFKLETGMTPKACYDRSRYDLACRFLRTSRMGLDMIAYRLHFSSAYHFSRFFKKYAGVPPREYRRGQEGALFSIRG